MNNKFGVKTEIGMTWEESMESQVENNFYIIPEQETKDSWKEKGIEYFRNFKGENTTTYKLGDESYMMVTEKKLEECQAWIGAMVEDACKDFLNQ